MAQFREMILKMEEWSTNSTAIKGSVSVAPLSFIVTKDSGMVPNQAVKVRVSESCSPITISSSLEG